MRGSQGHEIRGGREHKRGADRSPRGVLPDIPSEWESNFRHREHYGLGYRIVANPRFIPRGVRFCLEFISIGDVR